jgi:hypothetical protein
LVFFFCFTSCELFNNEQELFDDYGFEEGYFYYYGSERIPLLRYKGHVSLEFKDDVTEERRQEILNQYGLEIIQAQFVADFPGFYKVTKKPATAYYTTYFDTTLNRLGNRPEVDYVLPAYELDDHDDECNIYLTTNTLLHTFHDSMSTSEQESLLDSLALYDSVILQRYVSPIPTFYYLLTVTKESGLDPYTLVNRYHEANLFSSINVNYGMLICK